MAYAKRSTTTPEAVPVSVNKSASTLRAVSDAPTLASALEQLEGLAKFACSLVDRAETTADKLGRPTTEEPCYPTPLPYLGITGDIDRTIKEVANRLNEISDRISAIDSAID